LEVFHKTQLGDVPIFRLADHDGDILQARRLGARQRLSPAMIS
jgi:hypothetical protein